MNIIVGISGSIAAYKAPLLVRELQRKGATVRVVMTPSATKFIPALTVQNLTKHSVAVEMFDEAMQQGGSWHIHLARWCDAMIIAPCSAATLGKIAHGIGDTALVTVATALTPQKRLFLAPAMDTEMWQHPSTQRNCSLLRQDGAIIIPPAEGELASGFSGVGRLPEIDMLVKFVLEQGTTTTTQTPAYTPSASAPQAPAPQKEQNIPHIPHIPHIPPPTNDPFARYEAHSKRFEEFAQKLDPSQQPSQRPAEKKPEGLPNLASTPVVSVADAAEAGKFDAELELTKIKQARSGIKADSVPFPLVGKTVVITAGPTYEKIDDVRFIGNYSSGKMGFALAENAAALGATVQLVAGPVELPTPSGVQRVNVESAREMFDAVMQRRAEADVIILAAAVADFTPFEKHNGKLKKEETGDTMTLRLTKTPDILAAVGAIKGDKQVVVGFALEANNHLENAKKKLSSKRADMIVLNAVNAPQSGFGTPDNTITLVEQERVKEFPPMPKHACAEQILRRVGELLAV
ncbi:MAG: bifunctional phosphopantothenoylcysteine decarboxylase/phosphopantothenate synthase [Candidatus Kapaibacterium sp.]|nr:MAG: bifunctional phosphopantothenoylcysteine decarboxylase/phosphopantothenate synthase [Candidatus Kapabacteria bacterium]